MGVSALHIVFNDLDFWENNICLPEYYDGTYQYLISSENDEK